MEINYDKELKELKSDFNTESQELIEKAFLIALKGHKGQKRKSGDPYITHCIEVAKILKQLKMDAVTIAAGILHDILEDTDYKVEMIKNEINEEVAFLIEGLTYVTAKVFKTKGQVFSEALRKMFLAMSKDIRVVIIKLADRLHNLRTVQFLDEERQKQIAYETLNIYAPLAHRFGMQRIKSEMEDISFKILYPEQYNHIRESINVNKESREKEINDLIKEINELLIKNGINGKVSGRAKHFYSIYQKMVRENKTLDSIYDLNAIRIITDTVSNCYAILGIIHSVFKPIPGRFKDYIAMPKSNMYQSLHTTILNKEGKPVEIQIRTFEMDKIAEEGIAAHWIYKEQKKFDFKIDNYFSWVKQILELFGNLKEGEEFIKELKLDLFDEEIFVFTPKGDVKEFIKGATVLDFAYSIHSDLGDKCAGAKINGKWVSFKYELQNGDIVEILTSSTQHPSLDWLKIAKTAKAKNRIRHWLKTSENLKNNIENGKNLLNEKLLKHNISLDDISDEVINEILNNYNFTKKDDLFASIGFGEISENRIANNILRLLKESKSEPLSQPIKKDKKLKGDIIIQGDLSNIEYRFARCCNPVPGDEISGIVTKRGISIHRKNCENLKINKIASSFVEVDWIENIKNYYLSKLKISAFKEKNIFNDINEICKKENIYINSLNSYVEDGNLFYDLEIKVKNLNHLKEFLEKIKNLNGVKEVKRTG